MSALGYLRVNRKLRSRSPALLRMKIQPLAGEEMDQRAADPQRADPIVLAHITPSNTCGFARTLISLRKQSDGNAAICQGVRVFLAQAFVLGLHAGRGKTAGV